MNETIIYSLVIILLPIIPSLILYLSIPEQESEVEGEYQGLNIKLKGAFGSYFILALLLLGFITTRALTEHEFEYWTVEGVIEKNGVDNPELVAFSIQPPIRQITSDGHFIIENVPIHKGNMQRSTLSLRLVQNGQTKTQIIHLEKESHLPFKVHELEFEGDHVVIKTPIVLKLADSQSPQILGAGSYDPSTAQDPQNPQ